MGKSRKLFRHLLARCERNLEVERLLEALELIGRLLIEISIGKKVLPILRWLY